MTSSWAAGDLLRTCLEIFGDSENGKRAKLGATAAKWEQLRIRHLFGGEKVMSRSSTNDTLFIHISTGLALETLCMESRRRVLHGRC